MSSTSEVLIIGAGPAGLAIAACLQEKQISFDLLDRTGKIGGAYAHLYPPLTLASPTCFTHLPYFPSKITQEYIRVFEYYEYLQQYSEHYRFHVEAGEVQKIEPQSQGFRVFFQNQLERFYPIVVVATGMFDTPLCPPFEGLGSNPSENPEILHSKHWQGTLAFKGKRILIIGGATSAIEIAEECAQESIPVTLSTRGKGVYIWPQRFLGKDLHFYFTFFEALPLWMLGSFCRSHPTLPGTDLGFKDFQKAGKIQVHDSIHHFEGKKVFFKDGSQDFIDVVLYATGYRYHFPFLPLTHAFTRLGLPLARHGESISFPGLYFMGIPCAFRITSQFLRGIAKDAPCISQSISRSLLKKNRTSS
jgi:putative flavoprotein involved in K+ transport